MSNIVIILVNYLLNEFNRTTSFRNFVNDFQIIKFRCECFWRSCSYIISSRFFLKINFFIILKNIKGVILRCIFYKRLLTNFQDLLSFFCVNVFFFRFNANKRTLFFAAWLTFIFLSQHITITWISFSIKEINRIQFLVSLWLIEWKVVVTKELIYLLLITRTTWVLVFVFLLFIRCYINITFEILPKVVTLTRFYFKIEIWRFDSSSYCLTCTFFW